MSTGHCQTNPRAESAVLWWCSIENDRPSPSGPAYNHQAFWWRITLRSEDTSRIRHYCQMYLTTRPSSTSCWHFSNDIGVGHTLNEPHKKAMLTNAYTKDRQRLLENFFKSVFREGAGGASVHVGETRKDILECELTREEFADAMSLKRDSLFIEQKCSSWSTRTVTASSP